MNFPRLFIKDKHPLIDFAYYGSKARRAAHPDVLLGGYTECPMFREGDILDANAVLNLVKCVRWNEWASLEKLEKHIEDTIIHVTQEDRDRWDNNSFVLSDWNELDDTSYAYIKNKPDVYTKDEVYTKTIIDLMFATKADINLLSNVAISGDYNDLVNKPTIPTIPTNVSAFVNDAGYLTEHQDISGKLDVISDLDTIRSGSQAGSTALQPSALNDYYNKTLVDNKLSGKQDTINDLVTIRTGAGLGATALQPSALNDYYNKDQVDTKLGSKQDTISNLATIESGAAKGATAYQLPVTGIPSSDLSSTVLASLGKADTALQEHQDISGKVDTADVGVANGIAQLDENGKVPSSQLPSYVDDVLEYAGVSQFPQTGESGKIYVDTVTNKTYRWSGSDYREISESLALGETASTAYAGDKGKSVTDNFNTHAADTTIHITAAERTSWNAKVNTTDLATVATTGDYDDLLNKPNIPAMLVLSDWDQTTTTEPDYIKNKPTIPTVPTNVSAFTNDAGYLTLHLDISGKANIADLATVATSGSYTDLSNTPTIPSLTGYATETWVSNQGYITSAPVTSVNSLTGDVVLSIPAAQVNSDWNSSSGVSQILNKPSIPSNVSDLNNDSGFVTAEVEIGTSTPSASGVKLYIDTNADSTVEVYSKAQVNTLLANKPDMWTGTQVLYDAIVTKDANTLYIIISS